MTAADPITGASREQLAELARRFPDSFVEHKDNASYVAHHVINQRLLSVVGPFSFKLVEVIRGDVPAQAPDSQGRSRRAKAGTPALSDIVVGGVWRLIATVDGERVEVEEVGDVGDVHNWPHDGARLKDAASDALKRCAMRLGLGLSLWAQEHYFLDQQLAVAPPPQETTAATQESKPGGAGERDGGLENETPTHGTSSPSAQGETPANATTSTPPGFDHLTSPGKARAWLRGQPDGLMERVLAGAAQAGVSVGEAPLETLQKLILAAWRSQQAA